MKYTISFSSDDNVQITITDDNGNERVEDAPWITNSDFFMSFRIFENMVSKPVIKKKDRAELNTHAVRVGDTLGKLLFKQKDLENITARPGKGGPPPIVTIESDDDILLSLPWELIRANNEFLVREGLIDLVRTIPARGKDPVTLKKPKSFMKLVVNVSAPEGENIGNLQYEAETYRIARALHDYTEIFYTELGGMEDLVDAVEKQKPTGIHFSGHGMPGKLLFEDAEGFENLVPIDTLLHEIRTRAPDVFPRFFYMASCYGNTPSKLEEGKTGSSISSAQLHREGVVQVIGYFGPISDEMSTCAEEAVYRAIAEGKSTRHGVRMARSILTPKSDEKVEKGHKNKGSDNITDLLPFAWAQLVFYHRGPDFPLSLPLPEKYIQNQEAALKRQMEEIAGTRFLTTGFIGRRRELHSIHQKIRKGQRVFVFQGLGGLGKSTMAYRVLRAFGREIPKFVVWCGELEKADNQAAELVNRFSEFGLSLFGSGWMSVVMDVDRRPGLTPVQRFEIFLKVILDNIDRLVVYLDNIESLLEGPYNNDPKAFGKWRSPEVKAIWELLESSASDGLFVLASSRYRNPSFETSLFHLGEMGDASLFRMMSWFDTLRRLSLFARHRLIGKLSGHPRAVEYLDDLLKPELQKWENRYGVWSTPSDAEKIEDEWNNLVEPALPEVKEKIEDDLLLEHLWKNVIDDKSRRMLFRLSCLYRPCDWDLLMELGEPDEKKNRTEECAERLCGTSLVIQSEVRYDDKWQWRFSVHPATVRFISERIDSTEQEALRLETYLRAGTFLEKFVKTSQDIYDGLDAGHYMFECGEYDKSYEQLGPASQYLQVRGQVRLGIEILEPFAQSSVRDRLLPEIVGRMYGTLGSGYFRLAQFEKAIEYYEQALDISREIGDRREEGLRLGNLGNAYYSLGQVDKAIEYYEQALVISREIGDRFGEGQDFGSLGIAYSDLGQIDKAIEYYKQALVIAREKGDKRGEGSRLGNLGIAYSDLGQIDKAIEYYEQALVIARQTGDRQNEGYQLVNLGNAYISLGQVEKAKEFLEQSLSIAREIKDPRMEKITLNNLKKLEEKD